VYQAGTLSGNPLATAAGISTLEILGEPGAYEALEKTSRVLAEGLLEAALEAGVFVVVNRVGAMLTLFFTRDAKATVGNFIEAKACDTERFKLFFHAMLERGVYLPPSQFEAFFPGLAHTGEQIGETIEAARESFEIVAKG
jgi:glutamate-1-semialdehyde 2,1-aminomutase